MRPCAHRWMISSILDNRSFSSLIMSASFVAVTPPVVPDDDDDGADGASSRDVNWRWRFVASWKWVSCTSLQFRAHSPCCSFHSPPVPPVSPTSHRHCKKKILHPATNNFECTHLLRSSLCTLRSCRMHVNFSSYTSVQYAQSHLVIIIFCGILLSGWNENAKIDVNGFLMLKHTNAGHFPIPKPTNPVLCLYLMCGVEYHAATARRIYRCLTKFE